MNKIIDWLLFPRRLYKRTTSKKWIYILACWLVGFIDIVVYNFEELLENYFFNRPVDILIYNISLTIVLIIVIGFLDVICTVWPLCDIYRILSKDKDIKIVFSDRARMFQVYAISHILPVIISLVLLLLLPYQNIILVVLILTILWSSAIIVRGGDVIFNIKPSLKLIAIVITFFWSIILSMYGFAFLIETAFRLYK